MRPEDHPSERLDAWRTGELPPAERERVAAHLADCARCREELARLESWAGAFERGLRARREAAAGLEPDWAAQRAAIVARTSGRAAAERRGFWRWAPQAALVAVAAIVVGVVWREAGDDPVPRTPPAATSVEEGSPESRRRAADGVAEGLESTDERESAPESDAPARAGAPPPAAPAPAGNQAAAKAEGEPEREALEAQIRRDELGRQAEPAEEAALEDRAAADEVAPAAFRDPAEERERFERAARAALAARDTLGARRALALWADTLAPRLDADAAGAAAALADSLEGLVQGAE